MLNGPHVGCDLLFDLHVVWRYVCCVFLVVLTFCNVLPWTGFVIFRSCHMLLRLRATPAQDSQYFVSLGLFTCGFVFSYLLMGLTLPLLMRHFHINSIRMARINLFVIAVAFLNTFSILFGNEQRRFRSHIWAAPTCCTLPNRFENVSTLPLCNRKIWNCAAMTWIT